MVTEVVAQRSHGDSTLAVTARSSIAAEVERWLPWVILALAGSTLLWTRLIPLNGSLSGDEIHSVVTYIRPGPTAAFSHYIPNDHMLFELLTWLTTTVIADHSDAAYRFWSVIPALAATALMIWWLWRRIDRWVAAIFSVLAASSPQFMELSVEARGYGVAYLAAAGVLIGADSLVQSGERRALVLFAVSGLVGILTLPVFALPVVATVALLAWRRTLRRDVIVAFVAVGVAAILFYAPVLGAVGHSAGQHFGSQLPWYGVVTRPLGDLLAGNAQTLAPAQSMTVYYVVTGMLVAAGAGLLWLRAERFLALAMLGPALFGYVVLDVGRFYVAATFGSFLLLPLLALAAVTLVGCAGWLARARPLAPLVLVAAIVYSVFTLARTAVEFNRQWILPAVNDKQAAAIIASPKAKLRVVTNITSPAGLRYYLGAVRVTPLPPAKLARFFCRFGGRFAYIEQSFTTPGATARFAFESPPADTACLTRRGAFEIPVPQRAAGGMTLTVWILGVAPRSRSASGHNAAGSSA